MNNILAFFIILSSLNLDELKELAKSSFDKAEKQVITVVIPDVPIVEKCPCDGKGYIIQGDGHRSDCPGTSKGSCQFRREEPKPVIKTKPVPQKQMENGVVKFYHWRSGCKACELWKKNVKPKLEASGWVVKDVIVEGGTVPFFDIIMSGTSQRENGYLTIERLNSINSKYLERVK